MALRVVFDTNVVVAAFASPHGASRRLLPAVLEGRVTMLLSTPLLLEYEAVLSHPSNLAMIRSTRNDVLMVLDDIATPCEPVVLD